MDHGSYEVHNYSCNDGDTVNIYLAGPMRGYKDFNFPAFSKHAKRLRNKGHKVFSPAEKGAEKEAVVKPDIQYQLKFRRKVFQLDTDYICRKADAIAMMPGWEMSLGARAEHALALAVGLQVMYL